MLSKQAISEFKEIYFKRYGKTLTDEEAVANANNLLNLYKAVYQAPSEQSNREHL